MWALAKVAEGAIGANDADRIGAYLLLSTACDGTQETEARFTTVRVVCNNTLTMARGAAANVKIGHRSKFDAAKVKAKLGLATDTFVQFLDDADSLSRKLVTPAEAENFVRELLRPTRVTNEAKAIEVAAAIEQAREAVAASGGSDFANLLLGKPATIIASTTDADETKRAPKGEAEILGLFRGNGRGSNLATARGTAWGLVNAVTEYVDHKQSAKSLDHKLDRAFFGSGEELKNRAVEMALAI
jgi:hypothetical protein